MFLFWRSSDISTTLRRRFVRPLIVSIITVAVVAGFAGPAAATWSVVVSDTDSAEVGVGFASCITPSVLGEPETVLIPMVFVPGVGGGIYTDTVETAVDAEMLGLLSQGFSPEQILNNVLAVESESRARGQYSVVTVDGASAVRSGSAISGFEMNGASYAVHGNGVQPTVVTEVANSVEQSLKTDADLSDTVVEALLAGGDAGGDVRCGEQAALFAQVVVVGPQDTVEEPSYLLTVVVDEGDGQNPLTVLAAEHAKGSSGLIDVGTAGGRGVWVYLAAGILGVIMIGSGAVVFRYGIGNRAARK